MGQTEYFDRLIELRPLVENADGDLVPGETVSQAYAARRSVSRAAEFAAQTEGYRPERAYRLWSRDYHDEDLLTDTLDGLTFRIRRVYEKDCITELTVEKEVTADVTD